MRWFLAFLPLIGCADAGWTEGPGDARLTADTWAWSCDFDNEKWIGAKHFYVDLQHAPGLVETRPLPAPGACEVWGSTFAVDDLLAGSDVNEDGFLEWSYADGGTSDRVSTGTFQPLASGYWHSDAYDDHHTCFELDSVMRGGVEVSKGLDFEGVVTPNPGKLEWAELDVSILNGVDFGTNFTATWEASGWDDQFIIFNRSRGGWTVESVVCNVKGQTSFVVDDSFWGMTNPSTGSDLSRFFIGFRNVDKQVSDMDLKVETVSRALWNVAVIEE